MRSVSGSVSVSLSASPFLPSECCVVTAFGTCTVGVKDRYVNNKGLSDCNLPFRLMLRLPSRFVINCTSFSADKSVNDVLL